VFRTRARFDAALREAGYIAMGGQIVDASLIAAPKQRNTEGEKKAIKEGRIPEDWQRSPPSSATRTETPVSVPS
jgi:IS5 family transposase